MVVRALQRAKRLGGPMLRLYEDYLRAVRAGLTKDVVTALLAGKGDATEALRVLFAQAAVVKTAAAQLAGFAGAVVHAGQMTMQDMPPWAATTFNVANAFAKDANSKWAQEFFAEQTQDFKTALRLTAQQVADRELSAEAATRALKDSVGLTPYDIEVVANYRAELTRGAFAAAKARALHDKKLDSALTNLAKEGEAVPTAMMDRLVARYTDNMTRYRANSYLRTQSANAYKIGQHRAMQQIADDVPNAKIVKTWKGVMDSIERPTHRDMEGVTVGLDDYWNVQDAGPQMVPGDNEYNCRCVATYRVTRG